MNSVIRLFIQTLALLLGVYCFLFISVDLTNSPTFSASNAQLKYRECVRKPPRHRWSEGVHYPNQLYYEYIIAKDPEEHILKAPIINPNTKAIILVLSKNTEDVHRKEIRRSWGSKENPYLKNETVSLIFLVGDNDENLGCLYNEFNEFGDLLVVKALDSYRGLVYKLLMAYRYISAKYPNADLVKIDRDAVMDINGLVDTLTNQTKAEFIYGYLFYGAPPVRTQNHQWYVPESVFPGIWYPWYVNGNLYIISAKSLAALMNNTQSVKVLEIEDLFFTGILRNKANLSIAWLEGYTLPTPNLSLCPTDKQRKMFAHGIGDKIEERYKNFLNWRARQCNVSENEAIIAAMKKKTKKAESKKDEPQVVFSRPIQPTTTKKKV